MKHLVLLLGVLLMISSTSFAQVKKKFQSQKNKNETVVIKEDSDVTDQDILNSEFDINDFKVGESIRITTANDSKEIVDSKQKKTAKKSSAKVKKEKIKKFSGRSLSFSKKKSKKKKTEYVYYPSSKKSKGKDYSKKCYRW